MMWILLIVACTQRAAAPPSAADPLPKPPMVDTGPVTPDTGLAR